VLHKGGLGKIGGHYWTGVPGEKGGERRVGPRPPQGTQTVTPCCNIRTKVPGIKKWERNPEERNPGDVAYTRGEKVAQAKTK